MCLSKYYIYGHYKKDTNELFYIGKGSGNRISFKHSRSQFWNNTVSKHDYYYKIIEDNLSEIESFESEIFYINYFKTLGFKLCNLTVGGEGTSGHSFIPSDEWKNKKSKSQLGESNSFYNKKHTEESKNKIRISKLGKIPHNKKYFTKEEKRLAMNLLAKKYREQKKLKNYVG